MPERSKPAIYAVSHGEQEINRGYNFQTSKGMRNWNSCPRPPQSVTQCMDAKMCANLHDNRMYATMCFVSLIIWYCEFRVPANLHSMYITCLSSIFISRPNPIDISRPEFNLHFASWVQCKFSQNVNWVSDAKCKLDSNTKYVSWVRTRNVNRIWARNIDSKNVNYVSDAKNNKCETKNVN